MEHNEDDGIRQDLASDGEEIRASEQDTEISDTRSEEGSPESAPSDEDEDPADPPAMENKIIRGRGGVCSPEGPRDPAGHIEYHQPCGSPRRPRGSAEPLMTAAIHSDHVLGTGETRPQVFREHPLVEERLNQQQN
ncbi:unnamed protein product [Boreogadus saida]